MAVTKKQQEQEPSELIWRHSFITMDIYNNTEFRHLETVEHNRTIFATIYILAITK